MAAQFPTRPHATYPLEPSGPLHAILQDLPLEWPSVVVKEMKDHGATYGLPATTPVRRWLLIYELLTAAEAATLDAHYLDAQSTFEGFLFRHPRTLTLYSDVHYESYEYPEHKLVNVQSRRIVLIKRP